MGKQITTAAPLAAPSATGESQVLPALSDPPATTASFQKNNLLFLLIIINYGGTWQRKQ
jgi:hypothetical protein